MTASPFLRRRAPSVLALALAGAFALPGHAQEVPAPPDADPASDTVVLLQATGPAAPQAIAQPAIAPAAGAAAPQAAERAPAPHPVADAPEPGLPAPTAGAAPDPVAASTAAVEPPATEAEDDFASLYGDDPAAPGAAPAAAYDPWERYNRRMHRFNNAVDRRVARPLARVYVRALPAPVRGGVSNFFNNLGQPVSAINALLQGKPRQAAHSLGRFVMNSTLGIGGVFDPASAAALENRSEDFGQTLGVWGWKRSRYVELPLFGPRTLRDVVGMAGDAPLSPLRQVDADKIRVPLQGLQLVDLRAQLLSTDALREGVEDDYALVRDAWSQRRDYQIFGDAAGELPEYLREEPTVVPVDAMPVTLDP